jgi:transposase
MDDKKKLRKLSKNELIDIIFKQEKRLKKIENYLKFFENPHTPSSKQNKKNTKNEDNDQPEEDLNIQTKNINHEPKKPRFPGKPKGSKGGGIKLPKPDETIIHSLDISPISGKPLGDPINQRIQTVIDFPNKPIITTQHIIYQYKDPINGQIIEPKINLPKGIYGKNLQAIVIMLKEMVNSKVRIANFMKELGAPTFCHTTVQNISTLFILGLTPVRNEILRDLKKENYAHADETTMRLDGINRYVWGLFSKTKTIFLAGVTRGAYNFKKLIRNAKDIKLVVDGYKAYLEYIIQRCWPHLLREFKDNSKENKELKVQYTRIINLYDKLKKLNKGPPPEKEEIDKVKWELNDIVLCLKTIKGAESLATKIINGGDNWFTALYYEDMPLDNNLAERELRKVVLLRKTIGCIRTWKGKRWIEVVMSVIQTWKLQNLNIFNNLKQYAI